MFQGALKRDRIDFCERNETSIFNVIRLPMGGIKNYKCMAMFGGFVLKTHCLGWQYNGPMV